MAKKRALVMEAPPPVDIRDRHFQWLLAPSTISVDPGNGKMSIWRMTEGQLQHYTLPNARVRVTGTRMSREVTTMGEHEIIYADFLGERFGIGEAVWEQSDYPVETHANSEMRYGSEMHIFMMIAGLALMGVETSDPLTLIVPAPPGLVSRVAPKIKKTLLAGESGLEDGVWTIKLSGERQDRAYQVQKVIVIPEGAGAFAAYAFDANGNSVQVRHIEDGHDLLSGRVMIADGGMGTFDDYFIINGKLAPESIQHATDQNGGIQTHLIKPVMDFIAQKFEEMHESPPRLNQAQIDSWMRDWAKSFTEKDAQIVLNGKVLNLHGIFTRTANRYADWIIEEKLEPAWRRGTDTVIQVGGSWIYTQERVRRAYPRKNILHPGMCPHLRGIPLYDLNAYGALPLAANNKRVFKKVNT